MGPYDGPVLDGLLGVMAVGFWAFCLVDVGMAPSGRSRALPKLAWLAIVVVLNVVGGVLWLAIGRPRRQAEPVRTGPRPSARPRVTGPEDAPDFEARIQRGLRRQAGGHDSPDHP